MSANIELLRRVQILESESDSPKEWPKDELEKATAAANRDIKHENTCCRSQLYDLIINGRRALEMRETTGLTKQYVHYMINKVENGGNYKPVATEEDMIEIRYYRARCQTPGDIARMMERRLSWVRDILRAMPDDGYGKDDTKGAKD